MSTPKQDDPHRKRAKPAADQLGPKLGATDPVSGPSVIESMLALADGRTIPDDPPSHEEKLEAARRLGDAEFALALVEDEVSLFRSSGQSYAAWVEAGRPLFASLRSGRFAAVLRTRFRQETGRLLGNGACNAALQALKDSALDAPEKPIHLRTASIPEGICVAIGDLAGSVVAVTADGFAVTTESPVHFHSSSRSLPIPAPSGDLMLLRRHLKVTDVDFQLIIAWLTAALRPTGPYPVLMLFGEHGSTKTTASKILRWLIDGAQRAVPAERATWGGRALPTSKRDLNVAATHSHLLAYDNVSRIPDQMSDWFARLATGEEDGKRQLFTDADEVVFSAIRPILINGISNVITRPDLADRSVFIELAPIPFEERLPEREFWPRFERDAPAIMAGLLEVMVHGLKTLPQTVVKGLPRMADFALWGVAIESAHWEKGTFMDAYAANIASAMADVLDVDDLGVAIIELMTSKPQWSGKATDLFETLLQRQTPGLRRSRQFPTDPRHLSEQLNRINPVLRRRGIIIERVRAPTKDRTTTIMIKLD